MTDENGNGWYGPETATFGDRLAAAREHAGMSIADLAKRIGVKKTTIAGWENDVSEPRANRLSMVAGILNVSIPWLLTGQGDGPTAPAEEAEWSAEVNALFVEIRDIRTQMAQSADRLARLEKRLRTQLKESGL